MIKGLASNSNWKSDREMQRLRSLAGVFQRTNRILTGDRAIVVKLVGRQQIPQGMEDIPGWSSYPEININYSKFDGFHQTRTLVQLLGLNYHELSHLMFSPYQFRAKLPGSLGMAYNVLEDQRIESLFTAMYQPAGKYFTEMVVKFIIANESAWPTAFLWTHGRSFLPLEIRQEFEARFTLSKIMRTKAKRLINEYKTFTRSDFTNNYEEVKEVIAKFARILNQATQQNDGDIPNEGCGHPDGGGQGVSERTEKEAAKEDERRREEEEETGEDQSGFWEDEDEDDEEGEEASDGEGADGDDEGDGEEDGDDSGDGDSGGEGDEGDGADGSGSGEGGEEDEDDSAPDSGGDSDDDGADGDVSGDEAGEDDSDASHGDDGSGNGDGEVNDDHSDAEGGEAGGSSKTTESEWDDDELADYLDEIVEAVNQDDEVQREVQNITTAMNDLSNIDVIDFEGVSHQEMPVSASVNMALNKVTQHFRKLYAEVEPGWKYGSDIGRLNVGRYLNDPENYDEAFDEWDEGREHESGLEVVISVDISGSMAGLMASASTALWMIKRACDEVGASTTVLGFHSETRGLYDRKQKAPISHVPVWTELGGDTRPVQSMHLARRILSQSDLPNKLFVIITDGGWSGSNSEGDALRGWGGSAWTGLIESIPGTRMYVGLGGGRQYNEEAQKSFHVAKELGNDPVAIVPLVEAAITQMLTERRR